MVVKKFVLPTTRRFYQSVRMILKFWRKKNPQRLYDWRVNAVQFNSSLKLTATETEVEELTAIRHTEGADFELIVNDFGLLGTYGALPHGYTEWIAEQISCHNDIAIKHFLDIFNHRINTMRFDIWKKSHLFVARELDDNFHYPAIFNAVAGVSQHDSFITGFVRANNASLWNRRTLVNLVRLLQREFNCLVEIFPFQGAWIEIEPAARGRLGHSSLALESCAVLGKKYWDMHASFHIKIGPIEHPDTVKENEKLLKKIIQQYMYPSVSFTYEYVFPTVHCKNKINGQYQIGVNSCLGYYSVDRCFFSGSEKG
ncbi:MULTISPECIES: type VI secretion system baseplate subunit TssG [Enterobacter]|uniref:type VI secretion system baseplate subunit TssG n=1 Tax=Enterobacter TaxID=547 RepID=UPI0007AE2E2D|nr:MULTISPECIES: type VI secretion system baseplate subunit TssG [Enterobacter]AMZ77734.1 hypothetical protein A4308_12250 [Enterobacter sp. ODB01]EKS6337665.1 type VI secretion system baseplate subunit TssG [Enterobacter hormaechei]VAL43558.1 type VI secretion protein [Enterobacter kobei]